MSQTVPLIRTAAIVPWVRWLRANGRPVEARLSGCGLSFLRADQPDDPFPLLLLTKFIREQTELEGNDIGYRIVSDTSIRDLANLGLVALSAECPRSAILAISRHLPKHCSHEVISVEDRPEELLVSEHWHHVFDPATLHVIQQYVAALIHSLCRMTGGPTTDVGRVSMVPHPQTGLAHLAPWIDGPLEAATAPVLTLRIPNSVAHAPLPEFGLNPRQRTTLETSWSKLRERGVLRDSLEVVIEAVLPGGEVSIDLLARCAGMTRRTLQRRLEEEGTSASDLVEATRRRLALGRIAAGEGSFSALAQDLGYSNPSALTRSVRRWTGSSPKALRAAACDAGS